MNPLLVQTIKEQKEYICFLFHGGFFYLFDTVEGMVVIETAYQFPKKYKVNGLASPNFLLLNPATNNVILPDGKIADVTELNKALEELQQEELEPPKKK